MRKVIHTATAKICEDIEQAAPDELTEPEPIRRLVRLVAIAAVGGLLVAAIVAMASRIPKLQSEKKMVSSDSAANSMLGEARTKGHNINCPCHSQVMSWCDVTTFNIIKYNQTTATFMTFNLTKDEGGVYVNDGLCKAKNISYLDRVPICKQILSPVFNNKDSRTNLPTASAFTSPDLLYNAIAMGIDTNAYEESNVYSYLGVVNKTEIFTYSQGLIELIRTMQSQFLKNNFSASMESYWNASEIIRENYSLSSCFGMEVSWDMYLQTCKPAFCDVEFEISILNRVLRAMAQVGGITTLITLALKFLIWPSLRFALRFPTSRSQAAAS